MTRANAARRERRAHAHAKINLDLRILATRPDGYHELATVFQALALHDTVTVRGEPGPLRLTSSTPGVPVDASNLVWRAATALWSAAGRDGAPADLSIHLEKRIPVQAGLGGGSADAAAALVALERWWSLDWPASRLAEVGATLGADVPFFLLGGTAEGRGRGDRLVPLPDLPSHEVLLFVPGFGVSTADAYRWYDQDTAGSDSAPVSGYSPAPDGGSARSGPWPTDPAGWHAALTRCANDLEAPVAARHPEINELLECVRALARLAAMSGSGSVVFALFDAGGPIDEAARAGAALGWRVLQTRTLGRDDYRRSLLGEGPGASSELPPCSGFV